MNKTKHLPGLWIFRRQQASPPGKHIKFTGCQQPWKSSTGGPCTLRADSLSLTNCYSVSHSNHKEFETTGTSL